MTKNYGFRPDIENPDDYILGGSSPLPLEVLQASGDWTPHLPLKEFQNLNAIEPYACVAFTILNCVEILIKRKYGEDTNWSDRFLAAISGTKEGGNSPNVVCEFLRKVGVVPQEVWPFDSSITSFEKFYEPIPEAVKELAKEFNEKWIFKYENVPLHLIDVALTYSPLLVSVPAWFEKDGYYYRPDGMQDNHATTYIKKGFEYRLVFDSYDSELKRVHVSVNPQTIKRFWIEKRTNNLKQQISILQQIAALYQRIIDLILSSKIGRVIGAWFDAGAWGAVRGPLWSKTKREYAKIHPKVCPFCKTTKKIELHHIFPYHLFPQYENSFWNLVWACRDCHFKFCHHLDWSAFNPNVLEDIKWYKEKIENRQYEKTELIIELIGRLEKSRP